MNNGVTLAHFQSSGNTPEIKDLLKRSYKEIEIRSAHSRINPAEILPRPVALDLGNLFRCTKKNTIASWTEIAFVAIARNIIDII